MAEPRARVGAAFYSRGGGRLADWWVLLHPPYTLWHLSYVAMGAALAPRLSWPVLVGTLLAFFLAVGLAAHALDELHGRPLGTAISRRTLWILACAALAGAVLLGILAVLRTGLVLVPCIVIGVLLVLGYNLELFGGRLHTDVGFAAAWGGFPVLVGFLGQGPPLDGPRSAGALGLALAATSLSYAQRQLSSPARALRRRVSDIQGTATMVDGTQRRLDRETLLSPLEASLKTLSITMPVLAVALLLAHQTG